MNQQEQITNFQLQNPDQHYAFYFSEDVLRQLLKANPKVDGVRCYIGLDENGKLQLYANSCVGQHDYVPESITVAESGNGGKGGLPCPTYCS